MPIVLLFLFKMAVAICSMKRRHKALALMSALLYFTARAVVLNV